MPLYADVRWSELVAVMMMVRALYTKQPKYTSSFSVPRRLALARPFQCTLEYSAADSVRLPVLDGCARSRKAYQRGIDRVIQQSTPTLSGDDDDLHLFKRMLMLITTRCAALHSRLVTSQVSSVCRQRGPLDNDVVRFGGNLGGTT